MRSIAALALASLAGFGCSPQASQNAAGPRPERPGAIISDAMHGGVPGFNFLKPISPLPSSYLPAPATPPSPTVRIDRVTLAPAGCTTNCVATVVTPGVATFTLAGTTQANRLKLHNKPDDDGDSDLDDVPGGFFSADWNSSTTQDGFYRIHVTVPSNGGALELGFADVEVVDTAKQAKKVDDNLYVPLVEGRGLIIRFRIAAAALACQNVTCGASDQCHTAGVCDPLVGHCSNPAKADGASCDDGNGCTSGDTCQAGVCRGGPACGQNASCSGSGPSATCQCNAGYTGDGHTCTQPPPPPVQLKFLSFPPAAAVAGSTLRYQAVVTLAGGTTFALSHAPDGAQVDDSGLVTWTPTAQQAGSADFTLTASNGTASAAQHFTLAVAGVAQAAQGAFDPNDARGGSVSVQAPLSPVKGAALLVPQGALDAAATLSVSSVTGVSPPPVSLSVDATSLVPVEFGPAGATFSAPVHLVLPASPALLANGAKVLTLDAATGRWLPVQVDAVDAANGNVLASTTHLSTYVVVPNTPVYNLQLDLGGHQTSCFGTPLVRAPLAEPLASIPASAVNGWPLHDASGNVIPSSASSVADILAALPAGKALQFATRLDTKLTGTTSERQTFIVASATNTGSGLSLQVLTNRHTAQFLAIPARTFTPGDPEVEAWLSGARVSNLIDSVYADLAAGLGTGVSVTAEAAFAVLDADLASVPLPRPGIVYGSATVAKTIAQLQPLDGWDSDCDDAPDAWDPVPQSAPPPTLTGSPSPFIHTLVGSPVTLALSGPPGTTYAFAASDPTLNLSASGASAGITPSHRGVFSVTGSATLNGQTSLWTWQVLVDPPVIVDPPPTAQVTAARTTALVGQEVVLTASGSAARVTPDQLSYKWSASPDARALSATSGATVSLIASAPGDYTVTVIASDGVLSSAPASVVVSIADAGANRPPAPPLVLPVALHAQHAAGAPVNIAISATGTAADGSPATVQFAAAQGSPTSFAIATAPGGATFSTTADGNYQLLATAVDAAGNVSPATTLSILVTAILPPNPVDADGDGYPAGVGPGFDCNDGDPTVHPGQHAWCGTDLRDVNCSGTATNYLTCDADDDGYTVAQGDCDDHNPAVHPNAEELCDGVDNSCSGSIDKGYAGLGQACSAGVGQCKANGVLACGADKRSVVCNAIPSAPAAADVCGAGTDDNCNGIVGDGCGATSCPARPNMVATIVNGGCQYACAPGFGDADHDPSNGCECQITNGGVEICDGLDNNCDGRVDEGLTRTFYDGPAGTAGVGICRAGVQTCVNGAWVTVSQEQTPRAESCNGSDDNCDGRIDDGFDLTSDANNCGACGVTCTSTQHCIASACAANRPPSIAALAPVSMKEGQTVTVAVSGSDADNDTLAFTLGAGAPGWASIAAASTSAATLTLAPDASSRNLPNPITIEVDAADGHGGTAQAFLSVTLDHPPVIDLYQGLINGPLASNSFTARAGTNNIFFVQGWDAEGQDIAMTLASDGPGPFVETPLHWAGDPSYQWWPAANPTNRMVQWTPSPADVGTTRNFHATATDGATNAARDFSITVTKGLLGEAAVPGYRPSQASAPAIYEANGRRFLVVAEEIGLAVYEVTGDAVSPRLGFIDVPGGALSVGVLGHYAFVAAGWFGMDVVDLSDPAHPQRVANSYDPLGANWTNEVAVDPATNRVVTAAQEPTLFYLYDVNLFLQTGDGNQLNFTVFTTPAPDFFTAVPGRPTFLHLQNPARDILLVPDEAQTSLFAVDLAAAGGPVAVGQWLEQHNDNQFGARSVELFTVPQPSPFAGRQLAALNTGDGLWVEVLDVTDPTNMALVSAVNTNMSPSPASMTGTTWLSADAYFIDLEAIDFADPQNPVLVGPLYQTAGYQGGVAISADGSRLYDAQAVVGASIWRTADFTANEQTPNNINPIAQGPSLQPRNAVAVDGTTGIAAFRDQVMKLDTTTFPPIVRGTSVITQDVHGYQIVENVAVSGTRGITAESIWGGDVGIDRWIGVTWRTWDLSSDTPVELGRANIVDTSNINIQNRRVRFVNATCAVGAGGMLGAGLLDLSDPAHPVATRLQPVFNGQLLADAQTVNVDSDGRFLFEMVQNMPDAPNAAIFVWDLGSPANCQNAQLLGNVSRSFTLNGSLFESAVDVQRHLLYVVSEFGGGFKALDFSALYQAVAAGQTPDPAQIRLLQRKTNPWLSSVGFMLLAPSHFVFSTTLGPVIADRLPNGTIANFEPLFSSAGDAVDRPEQGGFLWWDASDAQNPNAFVEHGAHAVRKWALCGNADNTTCQAP